MSKIKQELASHDQRVPNEAAARETGAEIPEVFTLLPLSRTPMLAKVIKVQPAPFVYVPDDVPVDESEE